LVILGSSASDPRNSAPGIPFRAACVGTRDLAISLAWPLFRTSLPHLSPWLGTGTAR
jgi:hypothetical protein